MGAATLVRLRSALRPNSGPATGNSLQRQCACGQHTGGERCGDCKKREKMRLQRHANGSATPAIAPPIVDEVLHSPGQPMDAQTRALFEPRFDADFSGVRLHTDTRSEQSASAVNALAYAVGSHIVFGANQYAPQAETGRRLLAHELTHTLQQLPGNSSSIAIVDSAQQEREAEAAAAGVFSRPPSVFRNSTTPTSLFRQKADPDRPPAVDRTFELDPQRFLVPLAAPAVKQREKCEEFPGGATDCEVDQKTGTPTGKVTHHADDKNPCTKPCVQEHEAVHVKQLKTFCPEPRDCYLGSDKRKRPASDCVKMAMFGAKRAWDAYNVSVPCVEKRLKSAPECQTKDNKAYGTRKLGSEKCFQSKYCAGRGQNERAN